MSHHEIESSINAVKRGNSDAFENIVEMYQRPLYKYIRYIVYNQWDTDDILQDVFIKIYTNIHQYRSNSNFEGWLYKIAYNHTMSVLRKKAKEPFVLVERLPDVAYIDEYKTEMSSEMTTTLSQLNPDERAILFLRVHEELSYKDISKIMKNSESLLRKKYERAKKKFVKIYKEVLQDENRNIQ